jgi:hypothetical protein
MVVQLGDLVVLEDSAAAVLAAVVLEDWVV